MDQQYLTTGVYSTVEVLSPANDAWLALIVCYKDDFNALHQTNPLQSIAMISSPASR